MPRPNLRDRSQLAVLRHADGTDTEVRLPNVGTQGQPVTPIQVTYQGRSYGMSGDMVGGRPSYDEVVEATPAGSSDPGSHAGSWHDPDHPVRTRPDYLPPE